MVASLYLDTSGALRAALESGTTPDVEARIRAAPVLVTSRLALVESARAMLRVRSLGEMSEARLGSDESPRRSPLRDRVARNPDAAVDQLSALGPELSGPLVSRQIA